MMFAALIKDAQIVNTLTGTELSTLRQSGLKPFIK